nr:7-deoxyloganetin glucosyltransferase-like [Tanacetum cinerariifolium]
LWDPMLKNSGDHLVAAGLLDCDTQIGHPECSILDAKCLWFLGLYSLIPLKDPADLTNGSKKASAIVLNTFDELESDMLNELSSIYPHVYTIGPLHTIANSLVNKDLQLLGASLWKEETECLAWLESKEPNSVVYVNFGSITILQKEFTEATNDRRLLASWCPQEKVLNHPSVGGFLTHSGWNSTMESISGGVPMICWPFFAEQQTNCWYSCNRWGIGMEMDSDVNRKQVEKLRKSESSSSWSNIDNLINQVLLRS